MDTSLRIALLSLLVLVLTACPEDKPDGGGGGLPNVRCEVDVLGSGLFSNVGTGARAKVIEKSDELIGGMAADGRVGDYLLENDRIRVVVSAPGRHFGVVPYGGWIVDADLQRAEGTPGNDQFGRMGLLHAFGRTVQADTIEILSSGESGGAAVLAVTGRDALNDFVDLDAQIGQFLPGSVTLEVDPDLPLPLKMTTYYVLSPGESRVRAYTAFCNEGAEVVSIPVAELIDRGGDVEYFNPKGCNGTMGSDGCLIDPTSGFGFQGDGLAYGYRSYRFDNAETVNNDAALTVAGVVGVLVGAESQQGLLSWMDPQATKRPGTFGIRAGERRTFLRDFFITRDLAELTSTFAVLDGAQRGRLSVTVKGPDGQPAPGARVAVTDGDGRLQTLLVADASGKAKADLPPSTWRISAGKRGFAVEPPIEVQISTNGTTERELSLGPTRTLKVKVADPSGAPGPAKVTVLCPSGVCPTPAAKYAGFEETEPLPTNVAAVAFVGADGVLDVALAPGTYEVVVTRGPEYSAWPQSWPLSGAPVDLTVGDATLDAVLARVVDSTGWMSADLHVHGVNSPDSAVVHEERVLSFLAEGVDVLVSTDHDAITDYAPTVAALGAQAHMATMIGSEISSFSFGHFNAYPMVLRDEVRGGPFDWAGGDGPTLRAEQVFSGVKEQHPDAVVQINHPRGGLGTFTALKLDTDTFATHAPPEKFRMAPHPEATAADTRLFGDGFDVVEVTNGLTPSTPVMNDWMTMLSTGRRKAATAVSDTHDTFKTLGGYSRTVVELGADSPSQFDARAFALALKAQKAIGTNAPFVKVTARKVDASGAAVGTSVGLGGTVSVNAGGGEKVELTVEVQTPEWIRFDTLEVFTHADGRESLSGEENTGWLPPVATKTLDVATLPVEAVAGPTGGETYRRIHVTETFTLSPEKDTWYVVVVRAQSGAIGTLYPLAYSSVDCSGNLCTANAAKAYAFTNPIYVDADASGAYDTFPQKIQRGIRLPPPPAPRPSPGAERYVPTMEEFEAFLREVTHHRH